MCDYIPEDFPCTDIDWPEFVRQFGPEPALYLLDEYGGGGRKYIHAKRAARKNRNERLANVSAPE